MNPLLRSIGMSLYPNRCLICDKALSAGQTECSECAKLRLNYDTITGVVCETCGMQKKECVCVKRLFFEKSVFPYIYEGQVRGAIHRFKFRGRLDKAKPFARVMEEALRQRGALDNTDILTFIPMRKYSEFKRGYNQAEVLCAELSKMTGIKMLPLLEKIQKTGTQHSLKAAYRSGNVLGVFEPSREYAHEISGKNILVVDDVMTGGSTLNEAAKTLLIFGADSVICCTLAAGRNPGNRRKR